MVDEAQKALEEAEALKKVLHMFYYYGFLYKVTAFFVLLYCLHTILNFKWWKGQQSLQAQSKRSIFK